MDCNSYHHSNKCVPATPDPSLRDDRSSPHLYQECSVKTQSAGQTESLGGLQQPRARILQGNLGQEICEEKKQRISLEQGGDIEIHLLLTLSTHVLGKSAAEMGK